MLQRGRHDDSSDRLLFCGFCVTKNPTTVDCLNRNRMTGSIHVAATWIVAPASPDVNVVVTFASRTLLWASVPAFTKAWFKLSVQVVSPGNPELLLESARFPLKTVVIYGLASCRRKLCLTSGVEFVWKLVKMMNRIEILVTKNCVKHFPLKGAFLATVQNIPNRLAIRWVCDGHGAE